MYSDEFRQFTFLLISKSLSISNDFDENLHLPISFRESPEAHKPIRSSAKTLYTTERETNAQKCQKQQP